MKCMSPILREVFCPLENQEWQWFVPFFFQNSDYVSYKGVPYKTYCVYVMLAEEENDE